LTAAPLVARNGNEAVVAPMVGSGGVCSQAVGFVLVRLAGIWLQSAWRYVFTLNSLYEDFYKFWTLNVIYKDNAAINCINVQHTKKKFFPVNFDGTYYVSWRYNGHISMNKKGRFLNILEQFHIHDNAEKINFHVMFPSPLRSHKWSFPFRPSE
jgi:hypothetical protein